MSGSKKISLAFPLSMVLFEIATYLANDMYLPGLPMLAQDFVANQDMAQHTFMVWFLGAASMQLVVGPLSDKFGRKIVLVLGALIFSISSLACAITFDIELFLAARFVQGATICTVVVAGYAAIHELYDAKTAIQVTAIMASVTVLAPAVGPLLGALVLIFFDWRAIFWILAIWGVVAFALIMMLMPETNLNRHSLRIRPIVRDYWTILKNPSFLRYTIADCLLFLSFISWIVESPFVIMQTYHRSALEFGISQLWVFSAFVIGTQITRVCIEAYPARTLIRWGLGCAVLSSILLLIVSFYFEPHLELIILCMMLLSLGSSLCFSPLSRLSIDACVEPMGRRMAVSSALFSAAGVLATYIITFINDKTMANLCIPISGGIFLSLLCYALIRPSTKRAIAP